MEEREGGDGGERENRDWKQERTKPTLDQASNKAAPSKVQQPPHY